MRLNRRDAEEPGVEQVYLVDVGAETAGLALDVAVGEQVPHAPDAGTGNALDDCAFARLQLAPEGRETRCAGGNGTPSPLPLSALRLAFRGMSPRTG